jgi:biopolymer transport protein ExbD
MSKSASERRKTEMGEVTLNLNPMMDMFAVLIPALLMMSVVVEVASINVAAPSIGESSGEPEKQTDKPPLNLTVTVTEAGYLVSASGGPLANESGEPGTYQRPTIPIVERAVSCGRYRATVPPPRTRNKERAKCDPSKPEETRQFWVYDNKALHRLAIEIKDQNPDEHRITIGGTKEVDYEPIVDVMDATRDDMNDKEEVRPLFDEVVISPPAE